MKTKIYIFSNGVSRKNGGSSSLLDLANNLIALNYKATMITPFGKADKFIYKPTSVSTKLDIKILDKNIYAILEKKPTHKKILVNYFLNVFLLKNENIKNSIVIDGIGLPYKYLQNLRQHGTKIILNHAGSPNAYIKYFGMNGAKRDDLKSAKEEYLTMIKQYDYILFQSPTQAKTLQNMTDIKSNQLIILTPGVNEKDIKKVLKTKNILDKNNFNITIVGSIQQRKGQKHIIEIAKKLKNKITNIKFHILGNIVDENYYTDIKKEIEKNNLQKYIIFHGFRKNYLDYMKNSDIILQLSEEEGVSRVLREAMALGVPVVSFALDGTNDLLENNNDSLLCKYGDIKCISQSIERLFFNKELYKKLSNNIKENYNRKYSKNVYLKKLKKEIESIIKASYDS